MKYIGWGVVILIVLGGLNLIDVHICIKDAGQCVTRPTL